MQLRDHFRSPVNDTHSYAWFYPMTICMPLPALPIWLTPNLRINLPLEASYQETCRILGIA